MALKSFHNLLNATVRSSDHNWITKITIDTGIVFKMIQLLNNNVESVRKAAEIILNIVIYGCDGQKQLDSDGNLISYLHKLILNEDKNIQDYAFCCVANHFVRQLTKMQNINDSVLLQNIITKLTESNSMTKKQAAILFVNLTANSFNSPPFTTSHSLLIASITELVECQDIEIINVSYYHSFKSCKNEFSKFIVFSAIVEVYLSNV